MVSAHSKNDVIPSVRKHRALGFELGLRLELALRLGLAEIRFRASVVDKFQIFFLVI